MHNQDSYYSVNPARLYWNVHGDGPAARKAYFDALATAPDEPRLVSEYLQLCSKLGDSFEERLAFAEANQKLVLERDNACVELAPLLNQTKQPERALTLLEGRRFHPWEGGEGKVLKQFTQACLLIGLRALDEESYEYALEFFEKALVIPQNLGEAYHPLQAKADVSYLTGRALKALERSEEANTHFNSAADEAGDFQGWKRSLQSSSSSSCCWCLIAPADWSKSSAMQRLRSF